MNIRRFKLPSQAENKVQAVFYTSRVAVLLIVEIVKMRTKTLRDLRNHSEATQLRASLFHYGETLETISFDNWNNNTPSLNVFRPVLRFLERVSEDVSERGWNKLSRAWGDAQIIESAEREILALNSVEDDYLVIFKSGDVTMSPVLELLCSQEAARGYAMIGEWDSLSCTKLSVYEAVCDAQRDPFNMVPEHRRATTAHKSLEREARNLFLHLYRGGGMNLDSAYAAACVLTTQE
jgi:hypothetical protein